MTDEATQAGMQELSKDEFYAAVGPLNVHPRAERQAVYWETPNRVLLGITYPGYLCQGAERYYFKK